MFINKRKNIVVMKRSGIISIALLAALAASLIVVVSMSLLLRDHVTYDETVKLQYEFAVEPVARDARLRHKFACFVSPDQDEWYISAASKYSKFLSSKLYDIEHVSSGKHVTVSENYPDSNHAIDARMFLDHTQKAWFIYFHRGGMRVISQQDVDEGNTGSYIDLAYENMQLPQKNWAPYVYENKLYFITRFVPLKVVVADLDQTLPVNCTVVKDDAPDFVWDHEETFVRGSTPLVPLPGRGPVYFGLAHTAGLPNTDWRKLSTYRAIAVAYDAQKMQVLRISDPVDVFGSVAEKVKTVNPRRVSRVHFPSAVVVDGQDFLICIDVFDCKSLIFRWPVEKAVAWFDALPQVDLSEAKSRLLPTVYSNEGAFTLMASWLTCKKIRRVL